MSTTMDSICDDQDTLKKTQVKTLDSKAATNQWGIHKRILRPAFGNIEKLGFECSPEGEGAEGSFILIKFDADATDLPVAYFYTDLFVWLAFECAVIRRQGGRSQAAVRKCLKSLKTGSGGELVKVPRAFLVQAKGAEQLLALAGLHGREQFDWKHHVIQVANHMRPYTHPEMDLPRPLSEMKKLAAKEIRALVVDKDLLDGEP